MTSTDNHVPAAPEVPAAAEVPAASEVPAAAEHPAAEHAAAPPQATEPPDAEHLDAEHAAADHPNAAPQSAEHPAVAPRDAERPDAAPRDAEHSEADHPARIEAAEVPGLLRLTVTTAWRALAWTAGTSLRTSTGIIERAVNGDPPVLIVRDTVEEIRGALVTALGGYPGPSTLMHRPTRTPAGGATLDRKSVV